MRTTQATRRQFYIAMDMGCGSATAYGGSGFMMAVSRLEKPVTLRNGQVMRYSVAGFTCHWLTPSARGALAIVARCFTSGNAPLWRPFIASNAPDTTPAKQVNFADGTQRQRIMRAMRASEKHGARTHNMLETYTIQRDARGYLVTRETLQMGQWVTIEKRAVSLRAALDCITPLYDVEKYDAVWSVL